METEKFIELETLDGPKMVALSSIALVEPTMGHESTETTIHTNLPNGSGGNISFELRKRYAEVINLIKLADH
jgi:hypothetical protein